jgi:hypothetical protein
MGHSTTVYGGVAEYLAEGFIEHPQWGQFRRIESVALRGGRQLYIAHPASNPHGAGTAIATRDSTFNVISSEMPPWIGDQVAASRKDTAATNVRTATTVPETMEAMARPISLLSAGEGYSVTEPFCHRR